MSVRRAVTLLTAVGWLVRATPGQADEGQVTGALEWHRADGAEGCIDRETLAERVDRQLGRPAVVAASRGDVTIEGRVERAPAGRPGFRAHLTAARDGSPLGARDLGTDRAECAALDDSLTLVVALLIDPEHVLAERAPPSPAPPSPPAASDATLSPREWAGVREPWSPAVPEHDVPAVTRRSPWRAELDASGELLVGLMPSPAPGLRAAVSLLPASIPAVELGVEWFSNESTGSAAGGGSFGLVEGSLDVCPTIGRWSRLRLAACGGVDAGAMTAQGFGFSHLESHAEATVALGAGARATFHIAGPLLAFAGLRALVPLVRPDFVYADGAGKTPLIYQPAAVGGAAEVGLGTTIFQ
jgi:hypothetical protein